MHKVTTDHNQPEDLERFYRVREEAINQQANANQNKGCLSLFVGTAATLWLIWSYTPPRFTPLLTSLAITASSAFLMAKTKWRWRSLGFALFIAGVTLCIRSRSYVPAQKAPAAPRPAAKMVLANPNSPQYVLPITRERSLAE